MTRRAQLLAALLATSAFGCILNTADDEPKTSPYPALTVTGTVVDVRTGAVEGVHVLVWNEFDTGGADTDVDGNFTLIVDGSDSSSYISMAHAGYRPTGKATMTVNATSHDAGPRGIMSKDEVLFSTVSGDIYMVRVGGDGSLIPIATTAANEIYPCRSESGLTVRWANTTTGQVMEGPWNGVGATSVWTASAGTIEGMAWSPRATFLWVSDGNDAIVMAGEPSGVGSNYTYDWAGTAPDASPAAFGYFGPYAIEGNMLAFVTGAGISTAFPYFDNSFLVPDPIPNTVAGDDFVAWSPFRADGTLDLAFNRNYDVYATRVSASGHDNSWSAPARIYGGDAADANVLDIAWAPETTGADDRLVFAVHSIFAGAGSFEAGDLFVVTWSHTSGVATATAPTLLYDANGVGNVGKAAKVSWR